MTTFEVQQFNRGRLSEWVPEGISNRMTSGFQGASLMVTQGSSLILTRSIPSTVRFDVPTPALTKNEKKPVSKEISAIMVGDFLSLSDAVKNFATKSAALMSPELGQRVSEIANLSDGWDGANAKSVKSHILADAVALSERFRRELPTFTDPYLVPTFDGFVQIEWHGEKRSLDVEAVADGWSVVGTSYKAGNATAYHTADCARTDFEKLKSLYQWWSGDQLIWPLL